MQTFVDIIHIFVCVFLILVVLLQQGKGGGMGAAFGGGTAQTVFGGRGAGNILTRATAICATIFMLTSVGLAYMSSSGDANLRQFAAEKKAKEKAGKGQEGVKRGESEDDPSPETAGSGAAPATSAAPASSGD